jgi:hypothetical protein
MPHETASIPKQAAEREDALSAVSESTAEESPRAKKMPILFSIRGPSLSPRPNRKEES